MWVRGSRLRVPAGKLDAAISNFTKETVPKLKSIPGNAGAVLLAERQQSICLALTYWTDRASLDASETQASGLRAGVADTVGATIEDVQRHEIVVMEREGTPQAGKFVRSIQFALDTKRVDEGVTYFNQTVTPQLRRQNGFRAAIVGVDRQQGRGFISTVWETQADEQATKDSLAQLRKDGLERFGASQVTVETLESVYVEFAATAVTGR
jgi:heme-degrading monooxygenase HmoA